MLEFRFQDSIKHILANLERIDLLIQAQVQRARQVYQTDIAFQGLHISEEDVAALMEAPAGLPSWASVPWRDIDVHDAFDRLAAGIRAREDEIPQAVERLRLLRLAKLFELSPFDLDALLICLAPELDLRYERVYAFLQDDVTKKRPSVNLVLDLLCRSFEEKLAQRARFSAAAPLLRHGLILPAEESGGSPSFLCQPLRIDPRIADYLLGFDIFRIGPSGAVQSAEVPAAPDELVSSPAIVDRLERVAETLEAGGQAPFFFFDGADSLGKRRAAEAICRLLGIRLLILDAPRLAGCSLEEVERAVGRTVRESLLQNAAVYLRDVDAFLGAGGAYERGGLLEAFRSCRQPVVFAGRQPWKPSGLPKHRHFIRIEFGVPDRAQRAAIWARSLKGESGVGQAEVEALANAFRLNPAQVEDAEATARSLAFLREPRSPRIEHEDLQSACRHVSNHGIARLAVKVPVRYGWDDIVLPPDQFEQLREICNTVRYRPTVHEDWGFGPKLSYGKGLNVLFSGPSGAGKTMAAEVVAKDLGLDLYKIDLSCVVSKYIGETEKNLSQLFAEAETSNAILFFDEADALFGKRSEVGDAHDRYANIETGYLLQKMEEYDGTVILATNLRNNIDDAFARRMAFTVAFPFPEEEERLRIWQRGWPAEMPLASDVDLNFLATRFQLAGGNIKNITLAAAFLAAADGGPLEMRHLVRAIKRELQKLGKVCVEADFGPYYPLVQATGGGKGSWPGRAAARADGEPLEATGPLTPCSPARRPNGDARPAPADA